MLRHSGLLALRIVVVAGAYYVAGRLSNLLAIPPDYASAVWPAAGIALAAAILWGRAVLLGVFLGAFAVNLGQSQGDAIAAGSVALGAMLQAAAGAAIARRITGPGNPLDGPGSVLSTLFVAGPLSCLVSPTWGILTLLIVKPGLLQNPGFEWATWWAGDTIGVLVVLPVLLAWTAKPREVWRVRRWTLTLPLVACLALVVLLFVNSKTAEERREKSTMLNRQVPIGSAIVREIDRASSAVSAVASFFRASKEVEAAEFRIFAEEILDQVPCVRALEWVQAVPRDRRWEFEQLVRSRGDPDFEIREWPTSGPPPPEREPDGYFPVYFVEPREKYLSALGYDLSSEPVRWAGIKAAIATGLPTVTARSKLLQDAGDSSGVLLIVPVHRKAPLGADVAEPFRSVQGMALGILRIEDLVKSAIQGLDADGLVIHVEDHSDPRDVQRLHGTQAFHPRIDVDEHVWEEAGRTWNIRIGVAEAPPRVWSAWSVLAGGLLFTGLFGAFLLELATRHIHVERLVALRTIELARANNELQRSNLELQRFAHVASHDLREPLRTVGSYAQLLDESAGELLPPHRKFLDRIQGAAKRMQALVDDLLALSRVEGGAARIGMVPLEKLVGFALENLRPAIESAGARVEVGDLPTVSCDSSQIVQLFQNLIANAVKFRREGVVPYVSVQCRRDGGFFEIAVKDNGIGIAPEHHARVFEMFERLHTRERYGGTGIGLAICRKIVDRHGGRIWLESPPEGGSVFRFTLPAEEEIG